MGTCTSCWSVAVWAPECQIPCVPWGSDLIHLVWHSPWGHLSWGTVTIQISQCWKRQGSH